MEILKEILVWLLAIFQKEDKRSPEAPAQDVKKVEEVKVVYMISMKEILKNANLADQTPEIQDALAILLERINKIRDAYGKPMTVTSGLRTMADHKRIYAEKGITDESKIPMKSKHLFGKAIDIFDPKKELQAWCRANEKKLEEIGVWMEDFSATPNWCHFQTEPPRSGKRFFLP